MQGNNKNIKKISALINYIHSLQLYFFTFFNRLYLYHFILREPVPRSRD